MCARPIPRSSLSYAGNKVGRSCIRAVRRWRQSSPRLRTASVARDWGGSRSISRSRHRIREQARPKVRTHVLPDLLKRRRTHSANMPIPDGWLAALTLHPSNPLFDRLGHPKAFDPRAHADFRGLLRAYGPPEVVAEKARIARAVLAGERPEAYAPAPSRAGRTAARVALRQMLHTHPGVPGLGEWLSAFDHGTEHGRHRA